MTPLLAILVPKNKKIVFLFISSGLLILNEKKNYGGVKLITQY